MANVFGANLTRREVMGRVGSLTQLCGVTETRMCGGRADGMRALLVRTGGGLSYTLLPDRGLDISTAEFCGIPLSFISKSGISAPAYFDPDRTPWGGCFYGGLLTTCGLSQVGPVSEWEGVRHPVHGIVNNLPCDGLSLLQDWRENELVLGATGLINESRLYGENLELRRAVTSHFGESFIDIEDSVTNLGFERRPLMLLYHINFSYPLVGAGARLVADTQSTRAAQASPVGLPWDAYTDPLPDGDHSVYHHDLKADKTGMVAVSLQNSRLGIAADISWSKNELKNFTQWKLLRPGDYVTGLEPCNNMGLGVAKEQENGTLEFLEPFETRRFHVRLGFRNI